jgi:hypothetical protein
MMGIMKYRLLALCVALVILVAPVAAFADDDDPSVLEARLEGYANSMRAPAGSTALTWIMIGFLSAITIACFFKNAKRTHLD